MCGVVAGLTVAAAALQMKAQHDQTAAQVDAYRAQAANAEQNARINTVKSGQIAEQYAQQQEKLNDKRRLVRGQILAEQGASGVTGGSGLNILSSSNNAWQQDSINLLKNQRNDEYNNWAQTVNLNNQANAYETAANNTARQGRLAQLGTIVGTAASLYGMGGSGAKAATTSSSGSSDLMNIPAAIRPNSYGFGNWNTDYFNQTLAKQGTYTWNQIRSKYYW